MVELREITKNNLAEVLALSVAEHQKLFVSTTADSLAQAYVYRDTAFPFAVYAENKVVGFIMLGYYESRKQYTLWKFLIDKEYQGKGAVYVLGVRGNRAGRGWYGRVEIGMLEQ